MLAEVKNNTYTLHAHKIQNVQHNGNQELPLAAQNGSMCFVETAHLSLNIKYEKDAQIVKYLLIKSLISTAFVVHQV